LGKVELTRHWTGEQHGAADQVWVDGHSLATFSPDLPYQPPLFGPESLTPRFTMVFDREGYSPDFMARMWEKRIAYLTYNKYPGDHNENKLTVRLHQPANHCSSATILHLLEELNATRTTFPGTDLRLFYELVS